MIDDSDRSLLLTRSITISRHTTTTTTTTTNVGLHRSLDHLKAIRDIIR